MDPFRVSIARANGMPDSRIRSSEFHAPFHGVRSIHGVESDVEALCRAYAVKMRRDAAFSRATAAQLWGAPLPIRFATSPLRVSAPTGTAPIRGRGVAGHHHGPHVSVVRLRGLRVFSPTSTWLSLGGILALPDLVAVGDALTSGERAVCTSAELAAELELADRPRGAPNLRLALEHIQPGAESRPESLTRVLLVSAGIPTPVVNYRIDDLGVRVDLAWPTVKFGLEYDGGYHRDAQQFGADIRRQELIHDHGWLLMRVTKVDLFEMPDDLVARVRNRLAARGLVASPRRLSQNVLPRR